MARIGLLLLNIYVVDTCLFDFLKIQLYGVIGLDVSESREFRFSMKYFERVYENYWGLDPYIEVQGKWVLLWFCEAVCNTLARDPS